MQTSLFESTNEKQELNPEKKGQRPVRVPTLCSFCQWGHTISENEISVGEAESWCSNDKYEVQKGFNAWPKIFECADFKPDGWYYPGEVKHCIYFWTAAALREKEIDLAVKQLSECP